MKLEPINKEYNLDAAGIDAVSEALVKYCREIGTEKNSITRVRISIEESLAVWYHELGNSEESLTMRLETGKVFKVRPYARISVKGRRCNPYSDASEDFGSSGNNMLTSIGLAPVFSYENGRNILTYSVARRPKNQLTVLLLVIAFALLVGIGGKLLLPADLVEGVISGIIGPIEDTFFNILSCIAGPMIFLSVAWGVYGIGDVYTLGRIGKKLMAGFMMVVYLFVILGSFVYPLFGGGFTHNAIQGNQFGKIFEMILGIFPGDIITPFQEGNTLQIIFLGFIIGLSMIFLGRKTSSVASAIEQVNHIITFLMGIISKMVPYFVFIVLVRLIWSGDLALFTDMWKLALIFIGIYVVLIVLFGIYTGLRNGIPPGKLFMTCLPSFVIALTTASSAATFESNFSIATKKLHIKNSMASFSLPFGIVMFKPNTALYYLTLCIYLSTVYDTEVSMSWLIIAILITGICAVATPPIPGGSAATYTILFLQLGIPDTALAVALAVDIVFDFLMTAGDQMTLLFEVTNVSRRSGMMEE